NAQPGAAPLGMSRSGAGRARVVEPADPVIHEADPGVAAPAAAAARTQIHHKSALVLEAGADLGFGDEALTFGRIVVGEAPDEGRVSVKGIGSCMIVLVALIA